MYQQHPSTQLLDLFRDRPYQGVVPEKAALVFIGLDANYAENLEQTPSFSEVLEYHTDGVAFWRRHGVHHPFLLPGYRGDGRRYHQNFALLGFTSDSASKIAFMELLHLPTVGRSKLEVQDLDDRHLTRIDSLVQSNEHRKVFLSAGVARLMRSTGRFDWLDKPRSSSDVLPVLFSRGNTSVHLHLHFSNYGKFQAQMEREAQEIAAIASTL